MSTADTYVVPEAPAMPREIPIAINPDYFLRLQKLGTRKTRRAPDRTAIRYSRRASPICEACLYGQHKECVECGCLCLGEFRAQLRA